MELINYNNSQKSAIEHGSGHMMVIAGPGSGKTFVIIHRIKYLIEKMNISPNNILVLTFSKAAALQMESRFIQLCSKEKIHSKKVFFGTFHSFFFSILKRAYGYNSKQIATEEEKYKIIRELVAKHIENTEDISNLCTEILSEISFVKSEFINLEYYYPKSCSCDIFKTIYIKYNEYLAYYRKLDFEDMLVLTYELLTQRKDIQSACEKLYRYILIDEFQDINKIQYEIIKQISGKTSYLNIVGDDDQSIYRFRGAKPEIMLNFPKDFPEVYQVILDINYRSTAQIVDKSLKLISNNKSRFSKEIKSFRGNGEDISFRVYENRYEESRAIINDIKLYQKQNIALDKIAVLFRCNTQPRILTEMLMENNISFYIKDRIPNLYEHWIAKDLFAYLKLANGYGSRADLLRIYNRPNRYIKREAILNTYSDINTLCEYYQDQPFILKKVNELKLNLKRISSYKLSTAINFIRKGMGYDEFIEEYADIHSIETGELFDILDELEDSASSHSIFLEWLSHIEEYKALLEERYKNISEEDIKNSIRLMTFHSSKGLEYDIVYIIDVNEGIIPHKKSKSVEDIEEERRTFYVAVTRAKNILNIMSLKSNYKKSIEASIFINELK